MHSRQILVAKQSSPSSTLPISRIGLPMILSASRASTQTLLIRQRKDFWQVLTQWKMSPCLRAVIFLQSRSNRVTEEVTEEVTALNTRGRDSVAVNSPTLSIYQLHIAVWQCGTCLTRHQASEPEARFGMATDCTPKRAPEHSVL